MLFITFLQSIVSLANVVFSENFISTNENNVQQHKDCSSCYGCNYTLFFAKYVR